MSCYACYCTSHDKEWREQLWYADLTPRELAFTSFTSGLEGLYCAYRTSRMTIPSHAVIVFHSLHTLKIVSPVRIMCRRLRRVMAARQDHLSMCSSATADALSHTMNASPLVLTHVYANDGGGSLPIWDFACKVSRKSRRYGCTS